MVLLQMQFICLQHDHNGLWQDFFYSFPTDNRCDWLVKFISFWVHSILSKYLDMYTVEILDPIQQNQAKKSVGIWFFYLFFLNVLMLENAEILALIWCITCHYLREVSHMINQYFFSKFFCFILICDMFIGLYLK